MKNTVKRIVSVASAGLLIVSTLAFVGCGASKMTCEICETEKKSNSYTIEIDGETKTVCEDCSKLYDSITPKDESVEA